MDQPDGDGESGPQTYTFQTLDPPQAPTDLIASALFIRLEDIDPNHQGRKIRLTAQVLYFNPHSSLLLLAAHPHRAGLLTPTLLVDVTVPFLGQSPAVKSVYPADNASSHLANMPPMTTRAGHPGRAAKGTAREMLKLFEGEWVNEVYEAKLRQDHESSLEPKRYDRPFHIVLEAISITQARPPPPDAAYRREITERRDFERGRNTYM